MNDTGIGARIRDALEEKQITQREFAERIGVTEVAVSRWVNGTREPRVSYIPRLCAEMGVTAEYLLTGRK